MTQEPIETKNWADASSDDDDSDSDDQRPQSINSDDEDTKEESLAKSKSYKPEHRQRYNDNRRPDDRRSQYNNRRDRKPYHNKERRPQNRHRGNPNGNYELYYKNDWRFIRHCISKESAPFNFNVEAYWDDEMEAQLSEDRLNDVLDQKAGARARDIRHNGGNRYAFQVSLPVGTY